MSKIEEDALFLLIHAMSPSEKRFFKLHAHKNLQAKNAKFIQLFNYLSSISSYKESQLLEQNICAPHQLSNLKAHLYQKILDSLRQIPSLQSITVALRNEINNAVILYHKGLYQQSLKILSKARKKASVYDEHALHFEINKLEKVIESQYITRSEKNRANELIKDSNLLLERTVRETELMNLTLWLYNYLLRNGYCSSKKEQNMIESKVYEVLKDIEIEHLAFNEKLWWFKVQVWKNLLIRSALVEDASRDWVEHFYRHEDMIYMHPVWFIRGNHYLLQALFHNREKEKFDYYFNLFNATIQKESFPMNLNIKNLIFIYKNTAILNRDFLHLNFKSKHEWIYILNQTNKFNQVIDHHYLNIIRFKIGALLFIRRDYTDSQLALESVQQEVTNRQRDELYFYTQVLLLMNYYDGGDDENVEQVFVRLNGMVTKRALYSAFHTRLVEMLKNIFTASPLETKQIFKANREAMFQMKDDIDCRRSFKFLNLNTWFRSHLNNVELKEIIKKDYL